MRHGRQGLVAERILEHAPEVLEEGEDQCFLAAEPPALEFRERGTIIGPVEVILYEVDDAALAAAPVGRSAR